MAPLSTVRWMAVSSSPPTSSLKDPSLLVSLLGLQPLMPTWRRRLKGEEEEEKVVGGRGETKCDGGGGPYQGW